MADPLPKIAAPIEQAEWENALLDHFAKEVSFPLREEKIQIGGMEYFSFSCFGKDEHGSVSANGRSPVRRTAAVKCVAEFFERQFMGEFFRRGEQSVLAEQIDLGRQIESAESLPLPPKSFATSNGWAVHFNEPAARDNAIAEALERHLLLKSYLTFGWNGFNLENTISSPDITLYLLTSRYVRPQYISGLVIAKSPLYSGISLGYTFGDRNYVGEISFWERAILEAVDKIGMLKGKPISLEAEPNSWILREIKAHLETPFDPATLNKDHSPIAEDGASSVCLKVFDLRQHYKLKFPLFAAYAWGGDIIPLFHKARLDGNANAHLASILSRNGLKSDVPERHPIL